MPFLTQSERQEVEAILARAEEQLAQGAELLALAMEWEGDDLSMQYIQTRREQLRNAARIDGERLQELTNR
jgi:hypothetical protein